MYESTIADTEWVLGDNTDNCRVTWVWDYCTLSATANAGWPDSAIGLATDWVVESGIDAALLATASYVDVEYFGEA